MGATFDNPNDDPRKRRQMHPYAGYPSVSASPNGAPGSAVPPSGGYAPGGGLTEAAPGAKHGTGFVNLQSYLGANYGAGQGMAQHVAGETARQGDAERAALQGLAAGQMVPGELAGRAQDTAARARLAAPGGGGLGAVLGQDYGQTGPYTSGMSGFDAFLAGGAGGKTLQASGNAYGGLGGEVDARNVAAAAYVPPVAPVQPGPAGAVPSAGASGPGRMPVPAGYFGGTYAPEQREGRGYRGQQIDPGVQWWKKPMGGGG
jgi:hypothetical protein